MLPRRLGGGQITRPHPDIAPTTAELRHREIMNQINAAICNKAKTGRPKRMRMADSGLHHCGAKSGRYWFFVMNSARNSRSGPFVMPMARRFIIFISMPLMQFWLRIKPAAPLSRHPPRFRALALLGHRCTAPGCTTTPASEKPAQEPTWPDGVRRLKRSGWRRIRPLFAPFTTAMRCRPGCI